MQQLWLLTRKTDLLDDGRRVFLVVAPDPRSARRLVHAAGHHENSAWLDPAITACRALRADGPPRVVYQHVEGDL